MDSGGCRYLDGEGHGLTGFRRRLGTCFAVLFKPSLKLGLVDKESAMDFDNGAIKAGSVPASEHPKELVFGEEGRVGLRDFAGLHQAL
jgi:hypothetical protein